MIPIYCFFIDPENQRNQVVKLAEQCFEQSVMKLINCSKPRLIFRVIGTLERHKDFIIISNGSNMSKWSQTPSVLDHDDTPICFGNTLVCKIQGRDFVSLSHDDLELIKENMETIDLGEITSSNMDRKSTRVFNILRVQ